MFFFVVVHHPYNRCLSLFKYFDDVKFMVAIMCYWTSVQVINVTGISVGYGLSLACDTLMSQVKCWLGCVMIENRIIQNNMAKQNSNMIINLIFLIVHSLTQTFGSGNLKQVGVILQRGILILLLACFPCWAILINTQSILLAVKQNAEVARSTWHNMTC